MSGFLTINDSNRPAKKARICDANVVQLSEVIPCRSELAREKAKSTAGHLALRVIVHDHREQARSYRGAQCFLADLSRAKTCFPSWVRRYFCAGLLGDSGWVISIHWIASAGLR